MIVSSYGNHRFSIGWFLFCVYVQVFLNGYASVSRKCSHINIGLKSSWTVLTLNCAILMLLSVIILYYINVYIYNELDC